MDKKWRSGQPDGGQSYKKGRSSSFYDRPAGPVDPSTAAEDLADYVIRVLARNDQELQIHNETLSPGHIRIGVTCDPTLTGRIIGKGGKTISALRLLVRSAAHKRGKRVDIEVSS